MKGDLNLQSRGPGKVNAEPIPAALIAAGHFGRRMTELLLNIALINLSGAC